MGSEIFKLKSLSLEDTIVRGARQGTKNSETTGGLEIGNGSASVVKTGEQGVNAEYLVQTSVVRNEVKGQASVVHGDSSVAYSGPQDICTGDKFRFGNEERFYTVSDYSAGIITLEEKYLKPSADLPDLREDVCTIRKDKLGSAHIELIENQENSENFIYDRDKMEWRIPEGTTGIETERSVPGEFDLAEGIPVRFASSSKSNPDLVSVRSVRKTLVDGNSEEVYDVALSPIPYPHESLQVYIGNDGNVPEKKEEFEDYVVNYSKSPDLKYPFPPYEERESAYLKFLGKLEDEVQLDSLDPSFEGRISLVKEVVNENRSVDIPVQDIVPSGKFTVKVGDIELEENREFRVDRKAGIVSFINHHNSEELIDTVLYQKKLMWDGISVIRGVRREEVRDRDNLVIPEISGLSGIGHGVCFEDRDDNVLLQERDFLLDLETGAFSLVTPLRSEEAVLVSYFVEGENIARENLDTDEPRLSRFPIVPGSLNLVGKHTEGSRQKTLVLVEGEHYNVSCMTGKVYMNPEFDFSGFKTIKASYAPLAQVHCVLQKADSGYRITVVDDKLEIVNRSRMAYKIRNNTVSVKKRDLSKGEVVYRSSVTDILGIKDDLGYEFDPELCAYRDESREIRFESLPENRNSGSGMRATYTYESDVLPYAPLFAFSTTLKAGSSVFMVEGFDRRDILRPGRVLRMDSRDPESTYYSVIESVVYDGSNTTVSLGSVVPEDIRQPVFYLFDGEISWRDLPEGVSLEQGIPRGASELKLNGDIFRLSHVYPGTMIRLDDSCIHTVLSVETEGDALRLSIFPALTAESPDTISFSRLPPVIEGETVLRTEEYILSEPGEPAFKVEYNSPSGYEGNARLYIDRERVLIEEKLTGGTQPVLYSFDFSGYSTLSDMIRGITQTEADVKNHIPETESSRYSPFSSSVFIEDLSRPSNTLVSTDGDNFVDLPYVIQISELVSRSRGEAQELLHSSTDYSIENGKISLSDPVKRGDRFSVSYLGLSGLAESVGASITCSCRYISSLPPRSTVEVYMDYMNRDQFYIQKLTERKFTELVVNPQLNEIMSQSSEGGMGADSIPGMERIPNHEGGMHGLRYLLMDEGIKKQLYGRFFKWYKNRLRNFSAELRMILGFRFGNSNTVADTGDAYTLDENLVEDHTYTLTRTDDLDNITGKASKFFPHGYSKQAPLFYNRFGREYLSYYEVYCCNIQYTDSTGEKKKVAVIKAERPCWNRQSDIMFKAIEDEHVDKNLAGPYSVGINEDERTFYPSAYSFLRTLEDGDEVRINNVSDGYSRIYSIESPDFVDYEYLVIQDGVKGLREFDISSVDQITFDSVVSKLPSSGYRIWVRRQEKETFPMCDDNGSLGASAVGGYIEGHEKGTKKIRKPVFGDLFSLLLPGLNIEDAAKFDIYVKRDFSTGPDESWEKMGSVDLSHLSFAEERNIDDILEALKYGLEEKFKVPSVPPLPEVTVYGIDDSRSKGFYRYFYISFEKVYDTSTPEGYRDAIVFRSRNRGWWFKIVDGKGSPAVGDLGFVSGQVYKNFYEPDNLFKSLLLEKQAWETEELILRDIYDHTDKLFRAFEYGVPNNQLSRYKSYLASSGDNRGISDVLNQRILVIDKILRFLKSAHGPVNGVMKPDLINTEDEASSDISRSYSEAAQAISLYEGMYHRMQHYCALNQKNMHQWRNGYVRWVLSVDKGIVHQNAAREMLKETPQSITLGLYEFPAFKLMLRDQSKYHIEAECTVYETSGRKKLLIDFDAADLESGVYYDRESAVFDLYENADDSAVDQTVYKSADTLIAEMNSYTFNGIEIFEAENILDRFDNGILRNMVLVKNERITESGCILNATNVADHRGSDPRILFLYGGVEDRLYTNDTRNIPGIFFEYLGTYYRKALDEPVLKFTVSPGMEMAYGIFIDKSGKKTFSVKVKWAGSTSYSDSQVFNLYVSGYKSIGNLVEEINEWSSSHIEAEVINGYEDLSCEYMSGTDGYVEGTEEVKVYAHTDDSLDNVSGTFNGCAHRVFFDELYRKKLEVKFGSLQADGSTYRRVSEDPDTLFIFDFQKSDGTFKTLQEMALELSSFKYKGYRLFKAEVDPQTNPYSNLTSRNIVADNQARLLGFDNSGVLYVDPYQGAVRGGDIRKLENACFTFPRYTSNGNPAKAPIDGIPVPGRWEHPEDGEVLELECVDGEEWEVTFSDFDSGDYKSYMAPEDVVEMIDTTGVLTPEQFERIKTVEDQPSVTVLKELVLKRKSREGEHVTRYSLRRYSTIGELAEAINSTRFDSTGQQSERGSRQFYRARVLGSGGSYRSCELSADYAPIVRTFYVRTGEEGSSEEVTELKSNHLIGWGMSSYRYKAGTGQKHRFLMDRKTYTRGPESSFRVNGPEQAYYDTLENPQGFKKDTLAFNIYSWGDGAFFEIKDNWIYFSSNKISYDKLRDKGQPDKTKGYGIPLAGSGHGEAPGDELLSDLLSRINDDAVVGSEFFADLRFTRESKSPGFFEYGYLPDYRSSVPRSVLTDVSLKNMGLISISPGEGYKFTQSGYICERSEGYMVLSCDWEKDHEYEHAFSFMDHTSLSDLETAVSNQLAPEMSESVFQFTPLDTYQNYNSTTLVPTAGWKTVGQGGASVYVRGLGGVIAVGDVTVRNFSGDNFTVTEAQYMVPPSRDRLMVRCTIRYKNSFQTQIDLKKYTFEKLAVYISGLKDYEQSFFGPLFKAEEIHSGYGKLPAEKLLSSSGEIKHGTELIADLNDIAAMKFLSVNPGTGLEITEKEVKITGSRPGRFKIDSDLGLHGWIDRVRGDFKTGMISCGVLPLRLETSTEGVPGEMKISLDNEVNPVPVYFGILGDIEFIQISDANLRKQYNAVKERLGKPWADAEGNLLIDYYTSEMFNENNPYALDMKNFLGFLKDVRYRQIKESVEKEKLILNKYMWLYMMHHKEYGCYPKAKMIKEQIEKQEKNVEMLEDLL